MKTAKAIVAALIIVLLMAVAPPARAASNVTFAWDSVTATDLQGYRLYQSNTSGTYNKTTGKVCEVGAGVTTCTVSNLADGTYFWVATAYDRSGNESGYSNEVTRTLDSTAPTAPSNLKITLTITVGVQ